MSNIDHYRHEAARAVDGEPSRKKTRRQTGRASEQPQRSDTKQVVFCVLQQCGIQLGCLHSGYPKASSAAQPAARPESHTTE